jgi:hypothetical protein
MFNKLNAFCDAFKQNICYPFLRSLLKKLSPKQWQIV